MNRYLEKIAEKKDEEYETSLGTRLKAYMASGLGSVAALPFIPLNKGLNHLHDKRTAGSTFTKDDLSTIKKTVTEDGLRGKVTLVSGETADRIAKHKLNNAIGDSTFLANAKGDASHLKGGASFMPTRVFGGNKGIVSAGDRKNIATMLHEVGHANLDNKARGITTVARTGGNMLSATAPLLLMSGDKETRDKAMAVYLTGKAPELIDEAQANLYSLRKLQKHQGAAKALKHAGNLGIAYSTYLTGAAAGGAALYMGKKIADRIHESDEQKFKREQAKKAKRESVSREDS